MNQVSRRVPLIDGVAKVTGALRFTGELPVEGLLHGALVFSPRPHAHIRQVDASAALAVEGVHAVFWRGNTPDHRYNSSIWFAGQEALADEQMFPPAVRHIGDRVAAVVADTEEIARRAALLIKVDYEDLPAVIVPEAALACEGPVIEADGIPTFLNPVAEEHFTHGDPEAGFAAADLVVEASVSTPRSHHCAIEPPICIAKPQPNRTAAS